MLICNFFGGAVRDGYGLFRKVLFKKSCIKLGWELPFLAVLLVFRASGVTQAHKPCTTQQHTLARCDRFIEDRK